MAIQVEFGAGGGYNIVSNDLHSHDIDSDEIR